MKTIVINLLGAAGSGKSLIASEVFAKIKRLGISCENIPEYAKSVVYEENFKRLRDQLFIFASQYHSMKIAQESVRVLIVDSPLLLSIFYNKNFAQDDISDEVFEKLVMESYNRFDNLNFFITRNHTYHQEGRYQNEIEARKQEGELKELMFRLGVDVNYLNSTDACADIIVEKLLSRLKYLKDMKKDGLEIERKFKLKEIPEGLKNCRQDKIVQAYLQCGEKEVRVRSVNGKSFFLTEKTGKGMVRKEVEKEISKEEFIRLCKMSEGRILSKTRIYFPICGKFAEIDFYRGKHHKRAVVEVEFSTEEEACAFKIPSWFGEEVTNNDAYKNVNLACE